MWRKLIAVVVGAAVLSMMGTHDVDAAAKKRAAKVRAPKESMETIVRKAVEEAIKDSLPAASGKFEFTAKRMRPPKNTKWQKRWNELGQEGWQMVGNNENIYIFQRPGTVVAANTKADKKAAGAAAKADKKAAKEQGKAAEKTTKEKAKADKKTTKEAEKAAKKAAKQ